MNVPIWPTYSAAKGAEGFATSETTVGLRAPTNSRKLPAYIRRVSPAPHLNPPYDGVVATQTRRVPERFRRGAGIAPDTHL